MITQVLDPAREERRAMRFRQWMSPNPVTVTPQSSVLNARRLLRVHRLRHLPVVTNADQLVGIVNDRDIQVRDERVVLAPSVLQSDLLAGRYRCVETIMAAPVHTVRPNEPVRLAAKLMLRWQINGLPVTAHGRLVGIITTADCRRALLAGLEQDGRRPRASSVLLDDPDWYKLTPMPSGDDRPGGDGRVTDEPGGHETRPATSPGRGDAHQRTGPSSPQRSQT